MRMGAGVRADMRGLCVLILITLFFIQYGQSHDDSLMSEKLSKTHRRSRIRLALSNMDQHSILQVMGNIWNTASDSSKYKMISKLFNGHPPFRLSSIHELKKYNYRSTTRSEETTAFLEDFNNVSEDELLYNIETHAWPNLTKKSRKLILSFFQLSKSELVSHRSKIRKNKITDSNSIGDGNGNGNGDGNDGEWMNNAVQLGSTWYKECKIRSDCLYEFPNCNNTNHIFAQNYFVCIAPCTADEQCYNFVDVVNERSWRPVCLKQYGVCEGFTHSTGKASRNTIVSLLSFVCFMFFIFFQ